MNKFLIAIITILTIYKCYAAPPKLLVSGKNYCGDFECPVDTSRCVSTDQTIDEYATVVRRIKECQDNHGK